MKKILFLLGFGIFSLQLSAQEMLYGEEFETTNIETVNSLIEQPEEYLDKEITVRGNIAKVCQKAGCWVTITTDNDNTLFVKFGDHDFTVPLTITGPVIAHGKLVKRVTTVKELKHLAKDAGKSKKEIRKIKKPKTEYWFMADGVLVNG